MNWRIPILPAMLMAIVCLQACKGEDSYDHVDLMGSVLHHDRAIPGAKVYLKKGATAFPGSDVSVYDQSTEAGTDAGYHFHELEPDKYYLYAEGWDDGINDSVFGGVPIEISGEEEMEETDVPVTE